MTAITRLFSVDSSTPQIRPFDARRDLRQVADLVEMSFADTLDVDGRNYLRYMRSAARNPTFLRWTQVVNRRGGLPLSGYVWEENGRIVGNLTLIPFLGLRYRNFLIANVAVHPEYRRQGIARKLTAEAVAAVSSMGGTSVWLHVREENHAAGSLYRSQGFTERARRTTWHAPSGRSLELLRNEDLGDEPLPETGYRLRVRKAKDWAMQKSWLQRRYSQQLSWYLNLRLTALQPGWRGFFYRLMNDQSIRQWSVLKDDQLLGVVTWQATLGYADQLWLAAGEEGEQHSVAALLRYVRRQLSHLRPLALEYPADRAAQPIQTAGFSRHQTLVWMERQLV